MIRDYPYNLAPGASVNPPIKARYIGLKSCSVDAVAIQVTAANKDGSVLAEVLLQQGEKIPGLIQQSASVQITNTSTTETVDIVMVMGDSPFESDRSSGEVTIKGDVSLNPKPPTGYEGVRMLNGSGAGPADYYQSYVYNPEASTVDIHVMGFRVDKKVTSASYDMYHYTNKTDSEVQANTDTYTALYANRRAYTPKGKQGHRVNATKWLPSGAQGIAFLTSSCADVYKFDYPIVLKPGELLMGISGAVDSECWAMLDMIEIPN